MELYDKIIEIITQPDYTPQKPDELFAMTGESEEKRGEFMLSVSILEKDGVIVKTKRGKIVLLENSALIRGEFRSTARSFGFVVPEPEFASRLSGDIYIAREDTAGALNGDTVLASVGAKGSGSRNTEGKITKIIERNTTHIVGVLSEISSRAKRGRPVYYVLPDDPKLGFSLLVEPDGTIDAHIGDKVEAEITGYPTLRDGILSGAMGRITGIFGEDGSHEANYSAILHENDIRVEFDSAALEEAAALENLPISADGRLDLRDKLIITIDGEDAKDLDDAISVERSKSGWLLGVHIADVSEYVKAGTALDEEAFERGTSVYFTDKVVPMLPKELSNGICSLNTGVDRLALSAFISIDEAGEIIGCDFKESVISTAVRGVYSELNDIVKRGKDSDYSSKYAMLEGGALDDMLTLYRLLEKKSTARGALELETSEAKVILGDDGNVADIVKIERGVTERLIEQFMLCANEAVAGWLFWQNIPCVYRIHEDPSVEKLQMFSIFAHNLGLDIRPLRAKTIHPTALQQILNQAKELELAEIASFVLLRSLMKARYSADCTPHFGLAIEKYCHFTSPIRRYPDLAVHRILKKLIRGEIDERTVGELSEFTERAAAQSSDCEQRAVQAERDIEELYKVVYMSDRVGDSFDAVVCSVTSFGFFARLDNTCEGLVHINTLDGYYVYNEGTMSLSCGRSIYKLGDKVRVRIESVDVNNRKISFVIDDTDGDAHNLTKKNTPADRRPRRRK